MPFRQRRMTDNELLLIEWRIVAKGVEIGDMSKLHKFRFEPMDECGRGKVTIDDKSIKCTGYELRHYVGEVPSVDIEIGCVPQIEENATVKISNKEEIAMLMDKKEFNEFCEIWKEVHNEGNN